MEMAASVSLSPIVTLVSGGEGVIGTLGPGSGSVFPLNTGASSKSSGVSQCDLAAPGDIRLNMEEFLVTSCPSGHFAATILPLVEETTRGTDLLGVRLQGFALTSTESPGCMVLERTWHLSSAYASILLFWRAFCHAWIQLIQLASQKIPQGASP